MTEDALLVGIDLGTSSLRISAFTPSGEVVAVSKIKRTGVRGDIFDADHLWNDFVNVAQSLGLEDGDRRVVSIGITGHLGSVCIGNDGEAIGDASLWSDARGVEILEQVWSTNDDVALTVGRPIPSASSLALLCWLNRYRPEVMRQLRWIVSPKDYLLYRLTGSICTDWTSAAYSLNFDIRRRRWLDVATELTGIEESVFPRVVSSSSVIGELLPGVAGMIGWKKGIPVVAGGPDGTVGAAVLLGTDEQCIVDVAGTTDVLNTVSSVTPTKRLRNAIVNPYVSDNFWSYCGPTGMTGGCAVWVAKLLGFPDVRTAFTVLGKKIEEISPGCNGVWSSPELAGSRFPNWDLHEHAALWGLRECHGPAHVFCAVQEGVAYSIRRAFERLTEERKRELVPVCCIVGGGVASSSLLCQLRANVLGIEILAADDVEVSVRGAAMLAGIGVGIFQDINEAKNAMTPTLTHFSPNRVRHEAYEVLYRNWLKMMDNLRIIEKYDP